MPAMGWGWRAGEGKKGWFRGFPPTPLGGIRLAARGIRPFHKQCWTVCHVPGTLLETGDIKGCVAWAKEHGVKEVTAVEMKIINDKRSKEKGKG